MKKKNILMATYTLAIYAIVLGWLFTSCERTRPQETDPRGEEISEFQVVDINGDTITVHMSNNGGMPSSAYKK